MNSTDECKYAVIATDEGGEPVTDGGADTLPEARKLAKLFLDEFIDVKYVQVRDSDGWCVWDKHR